MKIKKIGIVLFVCLFLLTYYGEPVNAARFYYGGRLNGDVSGITWAISRNTFTLYGRTVNYYNPVLNAVSNWNGINPTSTSNVDVSISHTSNYSSATLRFIVGAYENTDWVGVINHYDSNNNFINPRTTSGNWSYAKIYYNATHTNQPNYTSTMLQTIAGHEIGHAFGLEDLSLSSDRYKLMWYKLDQYIANGITEHEINWIRIIYSN